MLLSLAIDRYVGSLEGAGYSPHTLKAYATRLTDFLHWCSREGDTTQENGSHNEVQVLALQSPEMIQAYLASLRRRQVGRRTGVSDTTLAHAFATLNGFYRFLERTLSIRPNPMRDVLRPRKQTSVDDEYKSLTLDQLHALLNTAQNGWNRSAGPPDLRTVNRRVQDALLISLMGLAGLRVSEACNLDCSDIHDDLAQVVGKGRKRRTVPLVPDILKLLDCYIPPQGHKHLFGMPSDEKRRLTPHSVEQRVPRLARRAGIFELRVTPHTLRHTFGSLMLSADPTALIPTRDLMGHESIETTNKYAHTREEDRRLALQSMQELRRRS